MNNDIVHSVKISDDLDVVVVVDDYPIDPREWIDESARCRISIRPHRRYSFAHEFDPSDIDASEYHVFPLDCYEHGSVYFRFASAPSGSYYDFDTSRDVWLIIVRKSGVKDEHEARDIAVANLREYNDYVNGNAYVVRVGKRVPFYDYESGCSIQSYYYEYDDDHEPEYVYGYSEAEKLAEKLAEKIKSSTN